MANKIFFFLFIFLIRHFYLIDLNYRESKTHPIFFVYSLVYVASDTRQERKKAPSSSAVLVAPQAFTRSPIQLNNK